MTSLGELPSHLTLEARPHLLVELFGGWSKASRHSWILEAVLLPTSRCCAFSMYDNHKEILFW